MVHKLSHMSGARPERLLVAAVRDKVSISLSDWIATQIIHGGTIEDVRKTLKSALDQINRVEGYVAEREHSSKTEAA